MALRQRRDPVTSRLVMCYASLTVIHLSPNGPSIVLGAELASMCCPVQFRVVIAPSTGGRSASTSAMTPHCRCSTSLQGQLRPWMQLLTG